MMNEEMTSEKIEKVVRSDEVGKHVFHSGAIAIREGEYFLSDVLMLSWSTWPKTDVEHFMTRTKRDVIWFGQDQEATLRAWNERFPDEAHETFEQLIGAVGFKVVNPLPPSHGWREKCQVRKWSGA